MCAASRFFNPNELNFFLWAILPYLRVHERFRWGQLNRLARSLVYSPQFEEQAMFESLRFSMGHLDADPLHLASTVPSGRSDLARLVKLSQKLTNWHMYGTRFINVALRRYKRAQKEELYRLAKRTLYLPLDQYSSSRQQSAGSYRAHPFIGGVDQCPCLHEAHVCAQRHLPNFCGQPQDLNEDVSRPCSHPLLFDAQQQERGFEYNARPGDSFYEQGSVRGHNTDLELDSMLGDRVDSDTSKTLLQRNSRISCFTPDRCDEEQFDSDDDDDYSVSSSAGSSHPASGLGSWSCPLVPVVNVLDKLVSSWLMESDPVLDEMAMRFTYCDTMKCRRKWDPELRSLVPYASDMSFDFGSLRDRILSIVDHHVPLHLTVVPLPHNDKPLMLHDKMPPIKAVSMTSSSGGSTTATSGGPVMRTFGRAQSNVVSFLRPHFQGRSSLPSRSRDASSFDSDDEHPSYGRWKDNTVFSRIVDRLLALNNTNQCKHPFCKRDEFWKDSPHSCSGHCREVIPQTSTNKTICTPYASCINETNASAAEANVASGNRCLVHMKSQDYVETSSALNSLLNYTDLNSMLEAVGTYLINKNVYHDDIFVPFVIEALVSDPAWVKELVREGYPMELLFWAWSICDECSWFTDCISQLPRPQHYKFPQYADLFHKRWDRPISRCLSFRKHRITPERRLATHYALSGDSTAYGLNAELTNCLRKGMSNMTAEARPWEYHPWTAASISKYTHPADEMRMDHARTSCVAAHTSLAQTVFRALRHRVIKLREMHSARPQVFYYAFSCFWDAPAYELKHCQ
eukprot:Blabericola_migrator_1__2644@NODE_174_length_12052_cov_318_013433_g151_i0_p3_GENE_NODE_174_length_12052_cov_318_013433_g151_i0NODE_174_length_12052_cov_318_013433_g151_i0_p3_ORF_typecomplete_len798_score44_61_NODE_174_length_12052_cov_318_013433_g151_i041546547